ncbi:MAG: YggS family pyridoxal phosphate-dependent enzyme [Planctomycetota bacterium]
MDNLSRIRDRIANAAIRAGRQPGDVTLVAVTKYVNFEVTKALVHSGQQILGESRPQVLWEKVEALRDLDVQWHMIGHLQRNKVNRTIGCCGLIHSVDSVRLLEAIQTAAANQQKISRCLLEVNISGEKEKHGFQTQELTDVLADASEMPNVAIKGLMGMASLSGSVAENQSEFAKLNEQFKALSVFNSGNVQLEHLSMGMSGDFEQAIAEGSTLVRVGSSLFEGVISR